MRAEVGCTSIKSAFVGKLSQNHLPNPQPTVHSQNPRIPHLPRQSAAYHTPSFLPPVFSPQNTSPPTSSATQSGQTRKYPTQTHPKGISSPTPTQNQQCSSSSRSHSHPLHSLQPPTGANRQKQRYSPRLPQRSAVYLTSSVHKMHWGPMSQVYAVSHPLHPSPCGSRRFGRRLLASVRR